MAEDWIKMRLNLHEDSAVISMAAELEMDEFSVVGRLHRLWSWADQQTEDGSVRNLSAKFVDKFISCPNFFSAMERVGWIKETENGFEFPNFATHNGDNAKKRAKENRRKSLGRKGKSVSAICPQNVRKMSAICPQNVRDLSAKCPEKTGPEKRREEKKREDTKNPPNPLPGEGAKTGAADAIPEVLDTPAFRVAFSDWQKFKRERGQGYKPTGLRTLLKQLAEWGPEKSILAIQNSMASNYAGLFEPRAGPGIGADLFGGLRDFVDSGGKK